MKEDFTSQKIPVVQEKAGWKVHPLEEGGEKLVSMKGVAKELFVVEAQYHIQGIAGSINDCFVRQSMKEMLIKAALKLPKGYKLVLWDGWRPLKVQESLFEEYKDKFSIEKPHLSGEKLIEYTQKYISLPSLDKSKPSPHNTGGSIDLTIMDSDGNYLDMGTAFDEMTPKAGIRYFEEKIERGEILTKKEFEILRNRRLLYWVMISSGFTSYHEEWWHFDYGNQWWGIVKNKNAFYGMINL